MPLIWTIRSQVHSESKPGQTLNPTASVKVSGLNLLYQNTAWLQAYRSVYLQSNNNGSNRSTCSISSVINLSSVSHCPPVQLCLYQLAMQSFFPPVNYCFTFTMWYLRGSWERKASLAHGNSLQKPKRKKGLEKAKERDTKTILWQTREDCL